ncbi:hypothetical protein BWR59_16965 [Pseudomonas sp. Bc-h]|jgi:hypothetical protein|uniref:hypothetical protein n=1 Tax=Pseudomonas sp. Bc-h TaxID=1943632 RepID=UPI0009DAD065|nr:hypothetical protein [Pseudomonas sp. Bc-h]OQR30250.1 hypothetical protein BWR59_16965 [Pseudomonas sp. Bc-h]
MSDDMDQKQPKIGKLDLPDEMMLLGGAMLAAQKLEFVLYGMASHLKKRGGKFKNLDPEEFLRGDGSTTKATLGDIVREFASDFQIDSEELTRLVGDRNLIAHDYWRMTKAKIRGGRSLQDPEDFLFRFISRCESWTAKCEGWLQLAIATIAERDGRSDEFVVTPESTAKLLEYLKHIANRQ